MTRPLGWQPGEPDHASRGRGHAVYDRLYTTEEFRFLRAAEEYRLVRHKRFLSATDYLEVLLGMGYRMQ